MAATIVDVETPSHSAVPDSDASMLRDVVAPTWNPPDIGLWSLLLEDFRTHDRRLLEQGFWALAVHRFGRWRLKIKSKVIRAPFSIVYKFLEKFVQWSCGISLPDTVLVGRRVRIWHHGGMILHAASIGDEVQIRQNTTFGVVRIDHSCELPSIDDGADIGAGACILGNTRIGRFATIGANAVVLESVPDFAVAVGVPAQVVKYDLRKKTNELC